MNFNLGNVVGLIVSETPPSKTYVLWARIMDPAFPNLVQFHVWDEASQEWTPYIEGSTLAPVLSVGPTDPSSLTPIVGDAYLVPAAGAIGAWSGKENNRAEWNGNQWLFTPPIEGYLINVIDELGIIRFFESGVWVQYQANANYVANPQDTLADLRAVDTTNPNDYPDKITVFVEENSSIYALDRDDNSTPDDNNLIIAPTVGVGRWKKTASGVVDHNDLLGLQGGNGTDEFYHLTQDEHTSIQQLQASIANEILFGTDINGDIVGYSISVIDTYPTRTYRTFQIGNWEDTSTFEVRNDEGAWEPAHRIPAQSDTLFIEATHTVTINEDQEIGDIWFNGTQDVKRLIFTPGTSKNLNVWGDLITYTGTADSPTPDGGGTGSGIDNWLDTNQTESTVTVTGLNDRTIMQNFTGNSRVGGFNLVIAALAGATFRTGKTNRCGYLTVASGTFITNDLDDMRIAGSDTAPSASPAVVPGDGTVLVKSGARYETAHIHKNTGTADGNQVASITIEEGGVIRAKTSGLRWSTLAFTCDGTLEFVNGMPSAAGIWGQVAGTVEIDQTFNLKSAFVSGNTSAYAIPNNVLVINNMTIDHEGSSAFSGVGTLTYGDNCYLEINQPTTLGSSLSQVLPNGGGASQLPRDLIINEPVILGENKQIRGASRLEELGELDLNGFTLSETGGGGSGDVSGPASSVDNGIARFNGVTGKIIQDGSGVSIDDNAVMSFSGAAPSIVGGSSLSSLIIWGENVGQGAYIELQGSGLNGEGRLGSVPASPVAGWENGLTGRFIVNPFFGTHDFVVQNPSALDFFTADVSTSRVGIGVGVTAPNYDLSIGTNNHGVDADTFDLTWSVFGFESFIMHAGYAQASQLLGAGVAPVNNARLSIAGGNNGPHINFTEGITGTHTIADGDLWYEGTSLNFRQGTTTYDLLNPGGGISTPGTTVDNTIVRWDGTAGDAIQGSSIVIDDSDNMTGIQQMSVADRMYHDGDADTYIAFTDNQISYRAANVENFRTNQFQMLVNPGNSSTMLFTVNSDTGTPAFQVDPNNSVVRIGNLTSTSSAHLAIAPSSTSRAHINFNDNVNPSTPADGDLWYNGVNFNIYDGTNTYDLIRGGAATLDDVCSNGSTWVNNTSPFTIGNNANPIGTVYFEVDNSGLSVDMAGNAGTAGWNFNASPGNITVGVGTGASALGLSMNSQFSFSFSNISHNTGVNISAGPGMLVGASTDVSTAATARLDVVGDLRVRTIGIDNTLDRVLVSDTLGNVSYKELNSFKYAPQVFTNTSSSSLTIDSDLFDNAFMTALSVGLTINAPTGTPVDGQRIIIRINDSGSAQSLTWNAVFREVGATLPTTTVANKALYVGTIYNALASTWDVLAINVED